MRERKKIMVYLPFSHVSYFFENHYCVKFHGARHSVASGSDKSKLDSFLKYLMKLR